MEEDRHIVADKALAEAMDGRFPPRVVNVLRACGISGIEGLLDYGRAALLRERNMGAVAISHLDNWLKSTDEHYFQRWMMPSRTDGDVRRRSRTRIGIWR